MRQRYSALGVLLAGATLLGGCSSASETSASESSASESAATQSESSAAASDSSGASASETAAGDPGQDAETSSPTPEPAPASTAQPPVASYPADPNQDPSVQLGPPPPAYQAPRAECPVEAEACVDLTNNMTWLQADGAVTYGPIQHIAGRQGFQTTPGMHAVSWKNIDHVSSIYDTPMPYAIFFTSTGMAFHQGELNIPSHGCVHLTPDAAAVYWENLHPGDQVYIFGEAQY